MSPRAASLSRILDRASPLRLAVWLELSKARLVALVVFTAAVGFVLATPARPDWVRLIWTMLGTFLAAAGANALNQWLEAAPDARMERTRTRPLPARRIGHRAALAFGAASGLGGPLLLWALVGPAAALLALAALAAYVAIYTPLKQRTPLNTLAGAVVGAIPPLMGWVAAVGRLDPGAWVLGGIVFLWQIPHFLALAWLYRDDYARGGFRMLPGEDPSGALTGYVVVLYTLVLVPLTLLLTPLGVTGGWYAIGAVLLGGSLLGAGVGLEWRRTAAAARRLFVASIVYLPGLLALMVVDAHLL